MKRNVIFLFVVLIVLGISISSIAQNSTPRDEMFNKIAALTKSKKEDDREKAYILGKEFISKFGKENKEQSAKITAYIDNHEQNKLDRLMDAGKTAEAFALGKEMLAKQPDNSYIMMNLAYVGYQAFSKGDKSFNAESIGFAKQALGAFEKGSLPKSVAPFKDQNEATSLMYFIIASLIYENDSNEGAINFYKSTLLDSQFKSKATSYSFIAVNYWKIYQKSATDFDAKHGKKATEDAEMKADMEKIYALLDRMIDAYARAVKLGENEKNPDAVSWKDDLAKIYQFRKKSDAGLAELINGILSTPMPNPASN